MLLERGRETVSRYILLDPTCSIIRLVASGDGDVSLYILAKVFLFLFLLILLEAW